MIGTEFKIIGLIMLIFNLSSCTYLDKEDKELNPYSVGETLIFRSSDGVIDSTTIVKERSGFPDGLGVTDYYEIYKVLAENEPPVEGSISDNKYPILTLVASTDERESYMVIRFRFDDVNYKSKRFPIQEVTASEKMQLSLPFGTLNDVIVLVDDTKYAEYSPKGVSVCYWSLSRGLVKFKLRNGTYWELNEIRYSE